MTTMPHPTDMLGDRSGGAGFRAEMALLRESQATDARDLADRSLVRDGEMFLDDYLASSRGYGREEIPRVRDAFRRTIFAGR